MIFLKKKSLGQNFLNDEKIIKRIVETANIDNNDIIIEVGPGNGVLTRALLDKKPKTLTVIEKDDRLVGILREKFQNKIKIINEDIKINYLKNLKKI